jgi:molecular chaperone HtpG
MSESTQAAQPIHFKAETRQILDILIHSLYTEREIFLRELISNASDALTRLDFEQLTNRDILDPDVELSIWITADPEQRLLTIRDSGIGMDARELTENLGTIAQSGARAFISAAKEGTSTEGSRLADIIGQFGVGFYSVFMVADSVRVTSRSYDLNAQAATWFCTGDDTFTVESSEHAQRGTTIEVKLKEDAAEFAQEHRIREIIRKHSDFIPYPIYIGDSQEQANQRNALWRQAPRQVEPKDYEEFYRQLTLEFEAPTAHTHLSFDAPVQAYAILYLPAKLERGMFSLRKDFGLKLYARKVLIQDYCKDLLPEYYQFIQGVVDSEDLPLNVSRESVQSNRVMAQLKKILTGKVTDMLQKLAADETEKYTHFWEEFGRFIKQGIALEPNEPEDLKKLLRFRTHTQPEVWSSLDDYVARMQDNQPAIYYIMGDDEHSIIYSPHLDVVRKHNYEVLLMTDPMDAFMLVRLKEYQGHKLLNVAQADLQLPETIESTSSETPTESAAVPAVPVEDWAGLIDRFKTHLGDKVQDVRMTDRLTDSPARLVDAEGSPNQEMQRVYRYLQQEFEVPKKVLEINPRHLILVRLNQLPSEEERSKLAIDQVYENALLIEGLLKDPASMIQRIQKLIEAALN